MRDILFKCAKCSKHLAISDRHAGRAVACPHCGNPITVPALDSDFSCSGCATTLAAPLDCVGDVFDCPQCGQNVIVPELRVVTTPSQPPQETCPYCNAWIANGAVICISCGVDLRTGTHLSSIRSDHQVQRETAERSAVPFILPGIGAILAVVAIGVFIALNAGKPPTRANKETDVKVSPLPLPQMHEPETQNKVTPSPVAVPAITGRVHILFKGKDLPLKQVPVYLIAFSRDFVKLESTEFSGGMTRHFGGFAYAELGGFEGEADPTVDECLEALEVGGFPAQRGEILLTDVFGSAAHAVGVADLIEGPFLLLGLTILSGD